MKRLLFSLLFLCPFFGLSQVSADAVLGIWLTESKDGKVEIYKKNNKYYGKVIWIAKPNDKNGKPLTDANNPDASLQKRPILNMDIITDLIFDNGEWSEGKVYDPKSGDSYTCKIWLEDGKLNLRGYWGLFYDTKTWTKVA
jgi:uncharacterized protein (DUF2147 family)